MSATTSTGARETLELSTDVLVIGGGPAATWAALTARSEGARVILADKGMCGSSGVAPAATVGHWWVDPEHREEAIAQRDEVGGHLSERSWMLAVAEETWRRWPELSFEHGYPAGTKNNILARRAGGRASNGANARLVQGPVYMREMRRRVSHSGVRILDHSPALELLVDQNGEVAGAAGVQRQKGRAYRIRAGAVILATGGCAWKSGSLGSHVNTGDGYLMGAEAGATLSGMEFSNYFGIVPKGGSMDKNGFNMVSTFYDIDGNVVQESWSGPAGAGGTGAKLIRAHVEGPIFQRLDLAPPEAREGMRAQMPNFFVNLDRLGIDPFTDRYEVEPINEGTVRGSGGLAMVDDTCWTGIPGLWVAGDTASREAIIGGSSGAGAHNAAWTISSGTWSGRAAAARALGGRTVASIEPGFSGLTPIGQAGLRPTGTPQPATDASADRRELLAAIQAEINDPAKNGLRTAARMTDSLRALDAIWSEVRSSLGIGSMANAETTREILASRETAAMAATARWAYASAAARTETRGLNVREDFPDSDPSQRRRVLVHGVDSPEVSFSEIADPMELQFEYAQEAAA